LSSFDRCLVCSVINAMSKLLLFSLIIVAACGGAPAPSVNTPGTEKLQSNVSTTPLSEIDLTNIGAIAPKGRVQDTEYNHLPVVENLIAHGNEAVPFLIAKLDDETKMKGHVFDYWSDVRVGDVAFIILTDFFTDPTWQKTTVPGVDYDEFLQRAPNSHVTGEQLLRKYIAKHGRHDITNRWREIWAQYKDRAHWDNSDRCFKVRNS
jgi:hypothetical protein